MRNKIEDIIVSAIKDLNEELENEKLNNPSKETKLYGGGNGALDSLSLVSLIADIEEKISIYFDKDIVLANEKAMSQKISPFRSVETLSKYIENLLKD